MSVVPESRIEDPLLKWKWRCVKETRNNSKRVKVELGWDGAGGGAGVGRGSNLQVTNYLQTNVCTYAHMCTRVRFEVNTLPMLK